MKALSTAGSYDAAAGRQGGQGDSEFPPFAPLDNPPLSHFTAGSLRRTEQRLALLALSESCTPCIAHRGVVVPLSP